MLKTLQLLLVLLISACSRSPKTPTENSAQVVETQEGPGPSKMLTFQPMAGGGNLHFSVYYPAGFSENRLFPVLIFFDPHGSPDVPLNKYRELADKYGFILLGSHESKNGNGARETSDIINGMAAQARRLPKADTSLIYAGGFSGGGRVAGMMGLAPLGIQGILTCGAGIPGGSWFGAPPNVIVSIGGTSDMNLHEVKEFNTQKQELMSRYFKLFFDGPHAWPPANEVELAMIIFKRMAMRDNYTAKDTGFIKESDQWLKAYINNQKDPVVEAEALYNVIRISESLTDISLLEKQYSNLKASPVYQTAEKYDQQLDQEEEKTKTRLYNEIFMKDTSWWNVTARALLDSSNFINDRKRIAMIHRVQGHLSLGIYTTLNCTIAGMRVDQGVYLSTLYRLIDPQNTEAWYLSAVVAMQMGLSGNAMTYLDKAVSLGFKDVGRCRQEPSFAAIQSDNRFQNILVKMQ